MIAKNLCVLAVASAFLFTTGVADAGIKWGNVLTDVLKSGNTSNSKRTVSAAKKTMVLDGSYHSGSGNAAKQQKREETIAVYSARLEEAASINWHFIGNGSGSFRFSLYAPDGQEIVSAFTSKNTTRDAFCVLEPGDYELKINFIGSSNTSGTYKFKGAKRVVPTNVSSDLSFIDDAGYLSYGVEAVNYFAASARRRDNFHYYAFNVPYSRSVYIVAKPYSKNIKTSFDILNADQVNIDRIYVYDENAKGKSLYLNSGKYFIRVNSDQRDGAVYGIKVE